MHISTDSSSTLASVFDKASLPFSTVKQSAILGHLLRGAEGSDSKFISYLLPYVTETWFTAPNAGTAWKIIKKIYTTYNRLPTYQEVVDHPDLYTAENSVKASIARLLSTALEDRKIHAQDMLKGELQDWIGAKIIYKALIDAGRFYNQEDWKGAVSRLEEAQKEYHKSKFELGTYRGFSELDDLIEGIDPSTLLSFGCRGLDEALLPGSTWGGARRGDQTVIIAPANIGKTTGVISVVANNIMSDKDALVVTHEGTRAALRRQMLRNLTALMTPSKFASILSETEFGAGLSKEELQMRGELMLTTLREAIPDEYSMGRMLMARHDPTYAQYRNDGAVIVLQILAMFMDRHCVHLSRNIAGQTVEELGAVIRQHQESWGEVHGKGFDIFADDYPAKLTTVQALGGKMDPYQSKGVVYDYFVSLADEMKWHSVVPDQTTMEGSKINKGISDRASRLLQQEDIGRGWEPVKTATNIWTINRSPEAQELNYMIWQLCKSRSSGTGIAVVTKSNFSWSLTHSDNLGWISYVGQEERKNLIKKFLLEAPGVVGKRLTRDDGWAT